MNIFDYHNYRIFLNDFLTYKKEKDKGFSQRAILKKMEINSTGFLANVLSGRNNLTQVQAENLTKILGLKKKDSQYFIELVLFTQAKTINDKNLHFENMVKIYKSKYRNLPNDLQSLFSKWHYAIIREIIGLIEFKDDFKALGKMVKPRISEIQAKRAIETLEKIELIKKDSNGIYRIHKSTTTTSNEIKSLHASNFLLKTMENAKFSLDNNIPKDRDISVLTLRVSKEKMLELKSEIKTFRKKLLQMAEQDNNKNLVYQCNINFFPVSEKID